MLSVFLHVRGLRDHGLGRCAEDVLSFPLSSVAVIFQIRDKEKGFEWNHDWSGHPRRYFLPASTLEGAAVTRDTVLCACDRVTPQALPW